MPGVLQDKIVIITGAAGGMGTSHVQRVLQEGAKVVLTDINKELGETFVTRLSSPSAVFLTHDVASEESWKSVVEQTVERFGRIDVLVNNAGIGGIKHIVDMSVEEYMRVIAIDQLSVFIGMKLVAPIMKKQGGGSIINISSVSGFNGSIGGAGYASAKFAVRGLTQTAALEFGPSNIRVNSIHPGIIATPLLGAAKDIQPLLEEFGKTVPLRRFGESREVSEAVLFLASDASSYLTAAELVVDGGMMASSHVFSDWLAKRQGRYFSADDKVE